MADLKSEPGEGLTLDAPHPFESKKSIGDTIDFKHLTVGQCHREGWYCWVCDEDCFSKVFDSLQARLSHYEEYHPNLILRCRIPECHAEEFVRESDRAKHMTKAHASVGLETILKLFQKGAMDRDVNLEGSSETLPCRLKVKQNVLPSTGVGASGEVGFSHRLIIPILSNSGSNPDLATDNLSYDCDDVLDAAEQKFSQIHGADSQTPSRSALTAMDRMLVDKLMKEFWTIFNAQWSAKIQLRGKASASRTQSISSQTSGKTNNRGNSSRQGQKHGRTDENRNSLEGEERNSKQAKPSPAVNNSLLKEPFACPYRKHDPKTYNHNNPLWRTCALKGFSTIPQLKAHLYRNHRNFQCQRCKMFFANEEGPHFHCVAAATATDILESKYDISGAIEQELRSLKYTYRDESGVSWWKEVYQLMFPGEEVPEPYFEAVQDGISGEADLDELSECQAYSRRELPLVFKNALEMAIVREARPVEHRMRSQFISMIQECQELVFST